MAVELKVPEVGESITEVMIGRWLVQEGQAVGKDDPVVELETDKVTLDLPAPVAGTVTRHGKQQGDQASVGDVIGYMEQGAGPAADGESAKAAAQGAVAEEEQKPAHTASPAAAGETQAPPQAPPQPTGQQPPGGTTAPDRVMPAARRLLEEHNLTAGDVAATGPGGRLLKQDVECYLKRQKPAPTGPAAPEPAPRPSAPPAAAAPQLAEDEDIVPMSPMRRRIAQRLVEAQHTAALLSTFNEIDMFAVSQLRNRYKQQFLDKFAVKLGFMSFFVKASIDALKQSPAVNAEIRGTNIVYKNHYDIGIAIGSDKSLVVPVLRNAEAMSFADIEQAIGDFVARIKGNKLRLEELQGGTFTITNGGVFGSMLSTPIVNPPQSAVLGMHAIQQRPVAINGEVKIRPMMYVALTYDHRLVDGREAITFLKRIKETIEDPARMLMEV